MAQKSLVQLVRNSRLFTTAQVAQKIKAANESLRKIFTTAQVAQKARQWNEQRLLNFTTAQVAQKDL